MNVYAQHLMPYFEFAHLPEGPLRDTSERVAILAHRMFMDLPAGPETTAGLRKLLEAKDCFVRAALDIAPAQKDDRA